MADEQSTTRLRGTCRGESAQPSVDRQRIIDAATKDRLLKYLCEKFPLGRAAEGGYLANDGKTLQELGIKRDEYFALTRRFEEEGFIVIDFPLSIRVEVGAHDFLNRGGYTLESEVFQKNIRLLFSQCEELERSKTIPEKLKGTAKTLLELLRTVIPLFSNSG